jgi:undecaprenyl-diphosphatase
VKIGWAAKAMDWDTELFLAINGLAGQWRWLDEFMRIVSRPATYWVSGFFALVYWYYRKGRQALVLTLVVLILIGIADLTAGRIKQLVARPRPCQVLTDVQRVTGCGRAFSFPSNHAVNSAAAATFFHMTYPKLAWVVWPITALIGFNRVYVGGHYATDVVGGWLMGAAGAWLLIRFLRGRGWINFSSSSPTKDDR